VGAIMPLNFKCFKNKNTGQVIYSEAGRLGNFKNNIKKLVSYIRYNIPRYYVAHLTLTVAENVPEIDFKDLHRVMQFISQRLKRAESDFKYIAVKELQERGAVHYHILCVYSKPYVFPSSNEIALSWKLGFVKITAPKLRMRLDTIVRYIGKYIGKGYEYEQLEVKKSFTASQIKQIYKLSPPRLEKVMFKFGREVAEKFKCTYRKVYEILEVAPLRGKVLVMEFPSEWDYVGLYPEPF
jgi:hypothetical protein